ncbi:MAG: hypothetical protein HY328_00415 [Chloroflexi bacterium]|nr:hypothetical protein [Chloroflexota bacterium]
MNEWAGGASQMDCDAYERLLCAVLLCAWRDATGKNAKLKAAALAWLHSDGAAALCDWLALDVGRVRQRCNRLPTDKMG